MEIHRAKQKDSHAAGADHLVDVFVDIRKIKAAGNPADGEVGDHFLECEAVNAMARRMSEKDGFPDEIMDGDKKNVGDDSCEVPQTVREHSEKSDADERDVDSELFGGPSAKGVPLSKRRARVRRRERAHAGTPSR